MDIDMPVMDGFESVKLIREHEREQIINSQRHTYIVMCTAYESDKQRIQCIAVGADSYLTKPVQKSQIKQLMQN